MFGGIFEEHSDVNGEKGDVSVHKTGYDSIPKPRSVSGNGGAGLVGITNQGATCYLNSLIQTLLFTPELRDAVFELPKDKLRQPGDPNYRPIPSELQMLFANMLLLDQANISTTRLTDSFGWKSREDFCQQDVQELNRILFSAIEDSLVGLTGSDIIRDLYRGTIVNQIRCTECDTVSEREEHFLDLTVAVAGYSSLADSLTDCYLNTESMSGKNQYRCDCCNKLVDGEKGAKLRELPPILTFCLLRLTFDFQTMRRQKETSKYNFPHEISMGAYMDAESSECLDYELFSVVVHRGGAHGGHYHALIKDIDELGNWTTPHGKMETSEKMQSKRQETEYLKFDHPSDLLDHILQQETDWITADHLSQRIQQETGVTWNKRFKKKYQTLSKFLINHPENYMFDEASRQVRCAAVADGTDDHRDKDECNDTLPSDELSVDNCEHWFSLDDRKVRPSHKSEVERYFGGKECAYMLYYRRKSLVRPVKAHRNVHHLVPEHIIESIEETNNSLRSQREAEELRIHTVNVKMYLPTEYTFNNGFIAAKSVHKFSEVSFDQRKTVEEFIIHLFNVLPSEEILGEDCHLYMVKCTHNAIHLLNDLSAEVSGESCLSSVGLCHDRGLLLLSKSLVEKHQVPCGLDHEPYQLTLTYKMDTEVLLVQKSLSLQELPALVMNKFNAEPPIYLYCNGEYKHKQVELPTHESTPLYRLVKDNSTLTVSHRSISCSDTANTKLNLLIVGGLDSIELKACSLSLEPTDNVSLLADLLENMLTDQYKLPSFVPFRFRHFVNNTPGIPLYHDRTIEQCHLSDGNTVMVEKGQPATSSQMVLYYQEQSNSTVNHSIVCKCTQTINQCIQLMVQNANLFDDQYYIMTLDWVGKPADVVYNTNNTLAKAKIKHGEMVALVKGIPPPKDAVTVTINWMSPSECLTENGDSYVQWLVNLMDDLTLVDDEMQPRRPKYASWSTLVGRKTSIQEIKCSLMSAFSEELSVESIDHLRLRAFINDNPGPIYKQNYRSLENYKLRGRTISMLAEILPTEEFLRENNILLSLRKKDLLTGDYGCRESFTWNTATSSSASHLRHEMARYLECPVNHLQLALFEPERFHWRLINDSTSAAVANNRTRRGRSKAVPKHLETNLKKAPYQIEDGDLIGYIIATDAHEGITEESFETVIEQRLRQISADKKREQRKEKGGQDGWVISDEDSCRSKEKAMSIQVGNFASAAGASSDGVSPS